MKLFRTDLINGFTDRLFEIPVESLNSPEIEFSSDTLQCTITSESSPHGYRINGRITVPFIFRCDRCLESYPDEQIIPVSFWVTEKLDFSEKEEVNTLFLPPISDSVDLNQIIYDLILVEKPVKCLCNSDCKGLCVQCGKNLNHQSCDCSDTFEKK